jgi:arylsulfatase A-like enzyme
MTDEQRGDALGGIPGSLVDTPYLTQLRTQGIYFPKAYTACPVCVPARRTLWTGKKPSNHGVMMNYSAPLSDTTLPEVLQQFGYQTHLCGKLHLFPERKRYGFASTDWADGCYSSDPENDYSRFLQENGLFNEAGLSHGMSYNGWAARPYHLDERYHYSTWCTDAALRFLERRDPTAPFFLNVSYHQPHAPCTPPAYYFDKYMALDLPDPVMGDWEEDLPNTQRGMPVNAWRVDPYARGIKEYRAGYYGCIEQIDHQIGRILYKLPKNTIILFLSDHGEMLGDHGWIRKRSGYEGSARIPLMMYLPDDLAESLTIKQGGVVDTAVELMDILPTVLDLLGVDIPSDVDGISLVGAMQGKAVERTYIHGECARLETIGSGMHYLTDGNEKYIWYPGLGKEQYFDLIEDPNELKDLAKTDTHEDKISVWRDRLVSVLTGRPEGFAANGKLRTLEGPTPICISEELMASGGPLKDTDYGRKPVRT